MSDVWLGVFLGMAAYKTFGTFAAAALRGRETAWGMSNVATQAVMAVVFMLLSVLVYTGVLP